MFTDEEAKLLVKTLAPLLTSSALKPLEKAALKTICADLGGDEFDKARFIGSLKWLTTCRDKKQMTNDGSKEYSTGENPSSPQAETG